MGIMYSHTAEDEDHRLVNIYIISSFMVAFPVETPGQLILALTSEFSKYDTSLPTRVTMSDGAIEVGSISISKKLSWFVFAINGKVVDPNEIVMVESRTMGSWPGSKRHIIWKAIYVAEQPVRVSYKDTNEQ